MRCSKMTERKKNFNLLTYIISIAYYIAKQFILNHHSTHIIVHYLLFILYVLIYVTHFEFIRLSLKVKSCHIFLNILNYHYCDL